MAFRSSTASCHSVYSRLLDAAGAFERAEPPKQLIRFIEDAAYLAATVHANFREFLLRDCEELASSYAHHFLSFRVAYSLLVKKPRWFHFHVGQLLTELLLLELFCNCERSL